MQPVYDLLMIVEGVDTTRIFCSRLTAGKQLPSEKHCGGLKFLG